MVDTNLFLLHQCLLVDHETQSGCWWSVCQCQRPNKDGPLYKSLCWRSEPMFFSFLFFFFSSGWTSGQKAICQPLICIPSSSSVMWWRLTTSSGYSPRFCSAHFGLVWLDRGLLEGNSSLSRQFQRSSNTWCIFTAPPTAPTAGVHCNSLTWFFFLKMAILQRITESMLSLWSKKPLTCCLSKGWSQESICSRTVFLDRGLRGVKGRDSWVHWWAALNYEYSSNLFLYFEC